LLGRGHKQQEDVGNTRCRRFRSTSWWRSRHAPTRPPSCAAPLRVGSCAAASRTTRPSAAGSVSGTPTASSHRSCAGKTTSFYPNSKSELYLVDTTAADATKVRMVTGDFPSSPLASRDGLLLVRAAKELHVCDPATGRSQVLPSEPTFPRDDPGQDYDPLKYVLFAGDSAGGGTGATVGRPFQLLIARLALSQHRYHLQIQIFSSEHDTWGPYTEVRIPNLYGVRLIRDLGMALVVGGAVHWLCLTNCGSYVIKLHVRAAQVTARELPGSFPSYGWHAQYLVATASPGGSPIVLVADNGNISAWSQSKQTMKWKQKPQLVIDDDELFRYALDMGGVRPVQVTEKVQLHWFAERSGLVLIEIRYCGFIWLDIRTMEIGKVVLGSFDKLQNRTLSLSDGFVILVSHL
ncbi:hypothetical protein EJB05_10690, partial [Eragrostis curvula]